MAVTAIAKTMSLPVMASSSVEMSALQSIVAEDISATESDSPDRSIVSRES